MNDASTSIISRQGFDELLVSLCDAMQSGEPVDLDSLVRDNPEYAEPLRNIYPTLLAITSLGSGEVGAGLDPFVQEETGKLGDFRIIRLLGRGGMGVVYEAQQLSMPRRVALKILPLASMVDPRALQRFRNEVAAIATLEHPHIVAVYAVGEERGIHYYAMKLIHGQSLATVIRELRARADRDERLSGESIRQAVSDESTEVARVTPLGEALPQQLSPAPDEADRSKPDPAADPGERDRDRETVARGGSQTARRVADPAYFRNVATLISQAAEALQHAHDHGIIHRDIKPGNLLLDARGTLFVTDFGLARIETEAGLTMTGDVLGTLRYMSPEQVQANRVMVDHRTDVYSLGATLYELVTLQPMWSGEGKAELIRQISFEEPTRPQRINPAIPTDLETIVLKTISKNPNDRYDTAQAFVADLTSYLELKPIVAPPRFDTAAEQVEPAKSRINVVGDHCFARRCTGPWDKQLFGFDGTHCQE